MKASQMFWFVAAVVFLITLVVSSGDVWVSVKLGAGFGAVMGGLLWLEREDS